MADAINVREDDLSGPEIAVLLQRHLDHMRSITPAESVYALDIEGLRVPEITFWTAWDGDDLVGCIALKDHGDSLGEIKSMHTLAERRGQGIARKLLETLMDEARSRRMERLSLETGRTEHFRPAQELYRRYGFKETSPFADYRDDTHSFFMTRMI
ncbi:MAG: GNAT family N-acetyltransferase [Pseudomonadota bacterium]